MQPINKESLEFFPQEFHNRLMKTDSGQYLISCQMRSELNKGNSMYYPMDAYVVLEKFSQSKDGTIIYEDT